MRPPGFEFPRDAMQPRPGSEAWEAPVLTKLDYGRCFKTNYAIDKRLSICLWLEVLNLKFYLGDR